MEIPPFLLADNTDQPDQYYVIHTQYPRFAFDVAEEEIDWWDRLEGTEEDLIDEVGSLLNEAREFFEREIRRHEEEFS